MLAVQELDNRIIFYNRLRCDVQLYALPIVMLVQVLVPKAEVMNKIKQNKKKEASRIGRVKKGSSIGHRLE